MIRVQQINFIYQRKLNQHSKIKKIIKQTNKVQSLVKNLKIKLISPFLPIGQKITGYIIFQKDLQHWKLMDAYKSYLVHFQLWVAKKMGQNRAYSANMILLNINN